jgi:hypothetical protein
MVHIGVQRLAVPAAIVIGVAIASCSSAPAPAKSAVPATKSAAATVSASVTASPAAPSSAVAVPAGYTRVGGAAQGISLAAPASWVAVNLAQETIQDAAKKVGLTGISAAQIVQAMASLQKLHAIAVYDVKYAVDNPDHVTPNLNAYCSASGVTDVGAAGVPLLKTSTSAEFEKAGATHINQQDLEIGGVPGIETSYQIQSSAVGTIYGSQLEVLPKANTICYVTVTGNGEPLGSVVSTAAATAQFP